MREVAFLTTSSPSSASAPAASRCEAFSKRTTGFLRTSWSTRSPMAKGGWAWPDPARRPGAAAKPEPVRFTGYR